MAGGADVSRRERILSAAAAEFSKHGFAGARVERIAATARVNKQLLFHYFGSKSGLHRAALAALLAEPSAASATPSTAMGPAERLRDLAAQLATAGDEHPALLTLLAAHRDEGDGATVAHAWLERAKNQARQILLDGQRAGYIRDDAELDTVTEIVVGASLGWIAAGDQKTAGRDTYRDVLVRMAMDFCAWR